MTKREPLCLHDYAARQRELSLGCARYERPGRYRSFLYGLAEAMDMLTEYLEAGRITLAPCEHTQQETDMPKNVKKSTKKTSPISRTKTVKGSAPRTGKATTQKRGKGKGY